MTPPNTTIALIGFANSGKTTLFNHLTGARYKTVNYPGSTVDFAQGKLIGHPNVTILDIPGINSLTARSNDEEIAIKSLSCLKSLIPADKNYPDLVISVVDSSQRTRHLNLTKQLIDAGFNTMVALTMTDLSKKQGKVLDIPKLKEKINCPILRIDGRKGTGIKRLTNTALTQAQKSPKTAPTILKRQEQDITNDYNWVKETLNQTKRDKVLKESRFDIDKLLLHWASGPLIFLGIMSLFFYSIFAVAGPFMDAVDSFFGLSSGWLMSVLPNTLVTQILVEGIWAGIGSVLVFVPQIAILFFGVGLLESSGYLSRGALIMDKLFSKIHLSGRSFVPLMSGCACAIPAMMAARNIPNKKERLLCMFIIPLMQCSARLPVYGVLLAILFPNSPLKSGLALTGIYVGSLMLAGIVAAVSAKALHLESKDSYFNIELPFWRTPVWRHLFYHVWQQSKSFVKGAGPIIITLAIVLWVLSSFPSPEQSFVMIIGKWIEPIFLPMGIDWRVGVAILLSFAAREIFVSVLVILFSIGGSEAGLLSALNTATFQGTTTPIFTTATSIGLIIFFMIAMQCAATLAIARKEMGSWRLPRIQLITFITLAYILSVGTVQTLRFFGIS